MVRFLLALACKNLLRYKRRTVITSVAIAVGLALFIIIDSILIGVDEDSVRNIRWYETSSVRIMHADYWKDRLLMPLDVHISDVQEKIGLLGEHGLTATPRITFSAQMILHAEDFGEDGNMPVVVTAVDPRTDNSVFRFEETLIDGRFATSGSNELVMGSWLAQDIRAKVGHWVTLVARGNGGFFEAMDMRIVGIVNCPNPNVNRSLIMVPIDTVGIYLDMEDLATEIDVALPASADPDEAAARIPEILGNGEQALAVMTWRELSSEYLAVIGMERKSSSIILFLVFLIAAVGISNTMIMAINERTRELGMMRALGMPDSLIQVLFIIESGGIGLLGSISGTVLGSVANIFLVRNGIDFGFLMRMNDFGYRVQGIFRGAWSVQSLATTFAAGVVLSMLVAWIPTRRAINKDIPACLRHQ